MPRYHFDLTDGHKDHDVEGTELPGLHEARAYAIQVAATYAGKPIFEGAAGGAIGVEVRDGAGTRVFDLRLVFDIEVY